MRDASKPAPTSDAPVWCLLCASFDTVFVVAGQLPGAGAVPRHRSLDRVPPLGAPLARADADALHQDAHDRAQGPRQRRREGECGLGSIRWVWRVCVCGGGGRRMGWSAWAVGRAGGVSVGWVGLCVGWVVCESEWVVAGEVEGMSMEGWNGVQVEGGNG